MVSLHLLKEVKEEAINRYKLYACASLEENILKLLPGSPTSHDNDKIRVSSLGK